MSLVDELRDYAEVYEATGNKNTRAYDLFARAAKELERISWKPASDWPLVSTWYLVICNEPGGAIYRTAAWANEEWYEEDGGFLIPITNYVVWWQPLPEVPEGE